MVTTVRMVKYDLRLYVCLLKILYCLFKNVNILFFRRIQQYKEITICYFLNSLYSPKQPTLKIGIYIPYMSALSEHTFLSEQESLFHTP